VIEAVRASNIDVGAKTVETGGMEFLVRGRGFIGSGKTIQGTIEDIENTVILTRDGIPVRVRDVAQVQTGPAFRDGALDLNGQEAVGGVVVMRYRENPRAVIQRVEERIRSLEAELDGIKIHGIYDRSILINETVATLTDALGQQVLITIVVVLLFLLHVRASLVVAVTLPIAVLMAFIGMKVFNVDANIMSLAGIAIAIGTMVDMGIIVSENIYRHLSDWEADGSPGGRPRRLAVIREGAGEVIPAVITAVSTTVISFLPVFFLTGRDYKLFAPLAWTKSFAMVASLILAVVLVPLLCRVLLVTVRWPRLAGLGSALSVGGLVGLLSYFVWGERLEHWTALSLPWTTALLTAIGAAAGYWITRENVKPVEQNPLSRMIVGGYEPLLRFLLAHKRGFMTCYALLILLGLGAWFGLPTVLRPIERAAAALGADLNAVPGYVRAKHVFTGLRTDDWIALDEGSWFYMPSLYPAGSFSQTMEVLQTQDAMIKQIPEVENVLGKIGRVESALDPAPVQMIETYVMLKPRDQWRPGMTERKIWDEINAVATLPGIPMASPLQPIEGRVVMLQAGIRASMAVRIYGDSLEGLAKPRATWPSISANCTTSTAGPSARISCWASPIWNSTWTARRPHATA
jgi:copper/silver efflux system protein